ncbi:MAG TPA: hypothetical protein ENN53_02695 [Candidatus Acetothermia bacterium]|nr:hypothetical protein [Candidatus Acetothermia bacterium]
MGRVSLDGRLEGTNPIALPVDYPHAPHLFSHGDELILFFLFRTGSGADCLGVQRLSGEGTLLGSLIPLSSEGEDVESYTVVKTEEGYVAAWESGGLELHLQAIPERLEPRPPPVSVASLGRAPALAVDRSGSVHAVWLVSPAPGIAEVYYSRMAPGDSAALAPRYLGKVTGGLGALFLNPALTLDHHWVYAVLSVDYRSGLQAGTVETHVFVVPLDGAAQVRKVSLYVPPLLPESFSNLGSGLLMAPVAEAPGPGTSVRAISGYPVEHDVGVIAVAAKLSSFRKEEFQPVLVFFQDGREVGWCPVAVTNGSPAAAELVQSASGWHIAWLDMHASGDYSVLYATTSPAERTVLDRFSSADLAYVILTVLSGLAAGLASIPLFLLAAVPGLVVIAGHYILGGEGDLRVGRSKVLLALGVVPYAVLKLMFISGLMARFPFEEWLAPSVARALSTALPVAFLGGGLLAAGLYWRRSPEPGLLPAYAVFVGVDILLSLVLVGASLAGA